MTASERDLLPILLVDPMPEAAARERLGESFTHAVAMGVPFCDRCRSDATDAENYGDAAAYETAGRIARLMRWIDEHSTPEQTIFNGDGTLTVASTAVDARGRTTVERDVIRATIRAARELLGY